LQPGLRGSLHVNGIIEYRIYTLDLTGQILDAVTIECRGDDEAIAKTKQMVDGHALDLWCGIKFLGHFEAKAE
jgi:hypothetical protein